MQMAKNFNKKLATDIATEKYVPNDVKFSFALDKLEEIYRNKRNENKKILTLVLDQKLMMSM